MDLSRIFGRAKNTLNINHLLRNQLLWMLLLRVVLYTLLLVISFLFPRSHYGVTALPSHLFVLLLLIVFLTSILSAFLLVVFQGNLRKFGFIQTLFDTCFASLLIFFSGASNSVFTSVFFFPIIAGGLILPRKGGLVAAAAATLQYGTLLFLETNGLYPAYLETYLTFTPTSPDVVLNHFAVHGLVFFLAAILSALFGLRLRKTESALTDSLKQFDRLSILYKQVFDNISTGIITIDEQEIITSANNAIRQVTGYEPLSLLGLKLQACFPNIELKMENIRLTTDYVKQDGSTVRIGYSHMNIQQTEADSKTPPHRIITLRDISEIEKLERQIRQTEKLAAIGMMSASIAHDFRNPLTAISGSAQVLANEFSTEGTKNYINFELANIILRESNRMIEEISDFLKFSRPENANCNWFSLRSCLQEVLQVCRADPAWPQTLKFVLNFEPTLDIWADEKQLNTVLNHLIQNAKAFCQRGREQIIINAFETRVNDSTPDFVTIEVIDNGLGIPESMRDQIFEPFFTTRPDGTGLGLTIIRQTIEEHHGTISVNNSEDGGAMFTITLPLPPP